MMPMTMMPNRSLFNIQSSKITSLDWARTAEPHTARPVAAKSPLLRAENLGGSGRRERTGRPTEVY